MWNYLPVVTVWHILSGRVFHQDPFFRHQTIGLCRLVGREGKHLHSWGKISSQSMHRGVSPISGNEFFTDLNRTMSSKSLPGPLCPSNPRPNPQSQGPQKKATAIPKKLVLSGVSKAYDSFWKSQSSAKDLARWCPSNKWIIIPLTCSKYHL